MAPTHQKTEVVSPAEVPEDLPLPSDPKVIFLGGLFVLAVLAAAYVAREIILPLVFAIVLKLLLQPAFRLLERLHVPRIIAALLLILALFGTVVVTSLRVKFRNAMASPKTRQRRMWMPGLIH
jgi:multisubunit Na+/H+ antiporter MnhE subunit